MWEDEHAKVLTLSLWPWNRLAGRVASLAEMSLGFMADDARSARAWERFTIGTVARGAGGPRTAMLCECGIATKGEGGRAAQIVHFRGYWTTRTLLLLDFNFSLLLPFSFSLSSRLLDPARASPATRRRRCHCQHLPSRVSPFVHVYVVHSRERFRRSRLGRGRWSVCSCPQSQASQRLTSNPQRRPPTRPPDVSTLILDPTPTIELVPDSRPAPANTREESRVDRFYPARRRRTTKGPAC